MRKLTHTEIAKKRQHLDAIEEAHRLPVTAVVDNVRSLYNIGSIFRTSDGVLLQKLILTGFTPTPPRKEIEKTALGATLSVPWEYVKEPHEAVLRLKNEGYKAYCLELADGSAPYYSPVQADFPICLVLGNEITGVSKQTISVCDEALEIPQFGTKQSLNVAVAYGVAIFELSRIWRNGSEDRTQAHQQPSLVTPS
ncbi:MAG: RNA methyltransferase [Ignavibacteriales bacterium]|nr:RNA methyltransferase [Ignavibacteriales bacterium]